MNKPPKEKPKTSMGWNMGRGEWERHMHLTFLMSVATVIVVVIVLIVSANQTPPTEFDAYERVYSECIAHETITHEQCHDIALEAIR